MTAIVGTGPDGTGKLRCNLHEFETLDINEWHNHCETSEGHALTGETLCEDCGQTVELGDGIPYTKDLKVKCPGCFDNYVNAHQNSRSGLKLKSSTFQSNQQSLGQGQGQIQQQGQNEGVVQQ